jgi:signal transduction histidine kinase
MSVELVSAMKTSTIAVVVLVLLSAGLATGVITTISRNRELTEQLDQAQAVRSQPAPATDAGRLRQLLDEQEAANAVLRDEIAQLKLSATNDAPAQAERTRAPNSNQVWNASRGPGNAWLDRLKQEDPERYKQIVQQREERRKAMDQRYQETMDQLDQRAQTAPTQVEADLVGQIADTLAKLNDLRQKWQAIRSLPEDQQQAQIPELSAQMRQTTDHLRDLSHAAAGLAHETRNPLGLIRGWTQRLADSKVLPSEHEQQARAILEEPPRLPGTQGARRRGRRI